MIIDTKKVNISNMNKLESSYHDLLVFITKTRQNIKKEMIKENRKGMSRLESVKDRLRTKLASRNKKFQAHPMLLESWKIDLEFYPDDNVINDKFVEYVDKNIDKFGTHAKNFVEYPELFRLAVIFQKFMTKDKLLSYKDIRNSNHKIKKAIDARGLANEYMNNRATEDEFRDVVKIAVDMHKNANDCEDIFGMCSSSARNLLKARLVDAHLDLSCRVESEVYSYMRTNEIVTESNDDGMLNDYRIKAEGIAEEWLYKYVDNSRLMAKILFEEVYCVHDFGSLFQK